jgi:hypothetical protein
VNTTRIAGWRRCLTWLPPRDQARVHLETAAGAGWLVRGDLALFAGGAHVGVQQNRCAGRVGLFFKHSFVDFLVRGAGRPRRAGASPWRRPVCAWACEPFRALR